MSKELGSVSEFVGVQSMDCHELVFEEFTILLLIDFIQLAETLSNLSVEVYVGTLLHATFQHHIAQFHFLTFSNVKFEKLMAAFFEVD